MVEISPRIQRLVVRSFPYQPFDVHYRRGKEIPLVDALSRVCPTPVEEDGIQLPIVAVNLITSNIPVSSTEIESIHEESTKDPTLNLLRHYIHMGWPIDRRMLPHELHTFWNYREDLSMENGLITKGTRLLIPSTLRRKVLEQIHEGHLGIEKCMLKARDSVFWPGISNDIRETVEKCGICQASSRAAKPVGNVSDVPPHTWHTLGSDLFYWNKIDYLVIGDYFSKYLIVRRLPNSSSHAVIKELGLVFTELGRPFVLRSDNGPRYSSREFHNFLSFYQVDHITSSRHYPQSNGFAEALVGITKKLIEKSVKKGKPWNYGLLQYRTTPISSTLPSPLEMLTGRKPCSSLPQLPSSIGQNMETSRIHQELLRRQPTTSTGAMDLEPGQPLFVKEVNGNVWRTATVDQPAAEPDSYWVRFPDDSIWEGPDQWSSQGLYLLILSFRLKHNRGTLKEKPTHVLVNPSVSWMDNQCCLLHQWQVWPIQQQLIGAAKSVKHPILSIPQSHFSMPLREEPPLVFLRLQHQDIQLDPPKVFLQFAILHPGSEWIKVMFHVCKCAMDRTISA